MEGHGYISAGYSKERGSENGQFDIPVHLAVDKNGLIFVADIDNNRIIALDQSLKQSRQLLLPSDCALNKPRSLCFDESRNRLYVGEARGRVLVFEILD